MSERLPCKRNKCLSYPACINKNVISCSILKQEYESLMNENKHLANRTAKTWGTIRMTLPNLLTIKGPFHKDKFGQYTSMSTTMPLDDFSNDMKWDLK